MTAITLLADCCADLGDAERAEYLYDAAGALPRGRTS